MPAGNTPRVPDSAFIALLAKYWAQHEYAPSIREIARMLNVKSTSTANYRVEGLVRKGVLRRRKGIARSLTLTLRGRAMYLRA